MFCLNQIKQLNLFDQVSELNYLSTNEPITFLALLSNKFDLESFITKTFYDKFYNTLGRRNRKYKLSSVLSALILMKIFHIPTNILLRVYSLFSLLKLGNFVSLITVFPMKLISVNLKGFSKKI